MKVKHGHMPGNSSNMLLSGRATSWSRV